MAVTRGVEYHFERLKTRAALHNIVVEHVCSIRNGARPINGDGQEVPKGTVAARL